SRGLLASASAISRRSAKLRLMVPALSPTDSSPILLRNLSTPTFLYPFSLRYLRIAGASFNICFSRSPARVGPAKTSQVATIATWFRMISTSWQQAQSSKRGLRPGRTKLKADLALLDYLRACLGQTFGRRQIIWRQVERYPLG